MSILRVPRLARLLMPLLAMSCAGCVVSEKDPGVKRDGIYDYTSNMIFRIRTGSQTLEAKGYVEIVDTVTRRLEFDFPFVFYETFVHHEKIATLNYPSIKWTNGSEISFSIYAKGSEFLAIIPSYNLVQENCIWWSIDGKDKQQYSMKEIKFFIKNIDGSREIDPYKEFDEVSICFDNTSLSRSYN